MAIDPVDGYGQITKGNAKEIYTAYRRGDVELNAAQKARTESFLSNEDYDEIDYDAGVANKDGKDQLGDDVKKAESHDGQGGNAAGSAGLAATASVGSLLFAPMVLEQAMKSGANLATCYTSLAAGAILAASGGAALASAKLFDNAYNDRLDVASNADSTNQIIDDNSSVLAESMDTMNEDMEEYKAQSDDYTKNVNDATANAAALEAQIADAEAAGDIEGANSLKEELRSIKENDFAENQEAMEETRGMLEEYAYANEMAIGVGEGGQTVSDFLKEGTAMGAIGTINTVALAASTVITLVNGGKALLTGIFPWEKAIAIAANILFMVGFALLGASTGVMANKTIKEFECGAAGRDMQGHVNDLNDMVEQQQGYMDTTTEGYDETDEKSQESQEKAKEAADKSNQNRTAGVGPVKKKDNVAEEKNDAGPVQTSTVKG